MTKSAKHLSVPALGILDWGIGGMGVLVEIRRRHPGIPVCYWSDTGTTPYGRMGAAQLVRRLRAVIAQMAADGVRHVVIACNAASTVRDRLQDAPVPIMGIIEHAAAAVPTSLHGTLGVIGGARTIRSGLYPRLLRRRGLQVVQRIAQPLSAHIEAGTSDTRACADDLVRILRPLRTASAILLACTHYPAIAEQIAAQAPRAVLLDPAAAVAAAVSRWPLATAPNRDRQDRYFTTGDPVAMRQAALRVWDLRLPPCIHRALPG